MEQDPSLEKRDRYGYLRHRSRQIDSVHSIDNHPEGLESIPVLSLNGRKKKEWAGILLDNWEKSPDPEKRIMFYLTGRNAYSTALKVIYGVFPAIENRGLKPNFYLDEMEPGKIAVIAKFEKPQDD